jgi:integrase
MARRRYQQGSLTKEGSRWVGRWREDVQLPSGDVKRIRRKEILGSLEELPTKKLAQRALAKRLEPVNHEDYRPTSTVTFGLFAEKWKKEIMIHHKPSSQSSEESIIDVHLVPYFGGDQLRNIKAERIQQFVNASRAAPKSLKNHISLLMVMWDMAKAWEYAQHNPFPRGTNGRLLIKLPRVVKGKGYNFTIEETLAIIHKAQGKWKVFFRILAETGMRPGELAGLRTSDVVGRTIRISQSVWQQKVQTPKTENAVRTFAISAWLSEAIWEVIDGSTTMDGNGDVPERGTMGNPYPGRRRSSLRCEGVLAVTIPPARHPDSRCNEQDQLLFTTPPGRKPGTGGRPLSMDDFRNRVLNPILDELGIRAKIQALGVRGGNYAFRHMNMTELSRLGVPLKTIQGRVGHALGSDVTMEHYIHAVSADDLAAADALGALLSPKGKEAVQ